MIFVRRHCFVNFILTCLLTFTRYNLKDIRSILFHIYFRLDDCELIPIFDSRDEEVDLKTVEPQGIPIKVCVMFHNALSNYLYWRCREKKQSFSSERLVIDCFNCIFISTDNLAYLMSFNSLVSWILYFLQHLLWT